MATGSVRNIWDILSDVNYEPNTLADKTGDLATANAAQRPNEGVHDVSKVSAELVGDNRSSSKSFDVTEITVQKPMLGGIPSLDVIRTRLKLNTRTNNKRVVSPRKQKEDKSSPKKKETKTVTESQRAKWRESKRRQRDRNKSQPSDSTPPAKGSRRSKKRRDGSTNCDGALDDSARHLSENATTSSQFGQMSVACSSRDHLTNLSGNLLTDIGDSSENNHFSVEDVGKAGSRPTSEGEASALSELKGSKPGTSVSLKGSALWQGEDQRTKESRSEPMDPGFTPARTGWTSTGSQPPAEGAVNPRAACLSEGSPSERRTLAQDISASQTFPVPKPILSSSAGNIWSRDPVSPMAGVRSVAGVCPATPTESRWLSGSSSVDRDLPAVDAPLDLSKKDSPGEGGNFTQIVDKERSLRPPAPSDDRPLDLTVRKTNFATPPPQPQPPPGVVREREVNKSAAIFEAFCLKPKQNRKVSPVRPHVRGKPVIVANTSTSACLIVDRKQLTVVGASPATALTLTPPQEPDYSVFSVKSRIPDMLKRKLAGGWVPSGRSLLLNRNGPTSSVVDDGRQVNGTPAMTSSPSVLSQRVQPVVRAADKTVAVTPILACDRTGRTIPTAHVKPNTFGDRRQWPIAPPSDRNRKRLRHSAELRKLLDQPPKTVGDLSLFTDDDGQGEAQAMPVLSPHGQAPVDSASGSRVKDDADLDVTPPPPALVRQQSPPLGKVAPPTGGGCPAEAITIDDDGDGDGRRNADITSKPSVVIDAVPSSGASVFRSSANDRLGSAQPFLSGHVAFTYSAPSKRKPIGGDISRTRFYGSLFGGRPAAAAAAGGSLDAQDAAAAVAERSRRNALESAFPKLALTDDWRRDMVQYKVTNLRIPARLVTVPKRVPDDFMRNIDRFIGARTTRSVLKRSYRYVVTGSRLASAGHVARSSCSVDEDEPTAQRPKLADGSGGLATDRKQTRGGRHGDDVGLVELSRADVIASLRTLFVPAELRSKRTVDGSLSGSEKSVDDSRGESASRNCEIRAEAKTTTFTKQKRPSADGGSASRRTWTDNGRINVDRISGQEAKTPNEQPSPSEGVGRPDVTAVKGSRRSSPRRTRNPRRYSPNRSTAGSPSSPAVAGQSERVDAAAERRGSSPQPSSCQTAGDAQSDDAAGRHQSGSSAADPDDHYATKRLKHGKKRRPRRSLLDELANTEGYVAEKRLAKSSDSLLVDPSQLSREERALQRAIMKFSEMEFLRKNKASFEMKSSKSTAKSSCRKKAGELKKNAINRHKASRSSPKHKFEDFKPIVLVARTRLQALSPEANKRPTVPRQHRAANSQRHNRRQTYVKRHTSTSPSRQQPATSTSQSTSTSPAASTHLSARTSSEQVQPKSKRLPTSARLCTSARLPASADRRKCKTGSGPSDGLSPRKRRKQSWSGCFLFSDRGRRSRRFRYDKRRSSVTSADPISARKALFESAHVEKSRPADGNDRSWSPAQQISTYSQPVANSPCQTMVFESQPTFAQVDDDVMPTCSNTQGEFSKHNIPPEVKRLNVCKETGETILHKAARMGYTDIVLWCCRTRYVDVNARDYAGFSALHETCVSESVKTARCLLEHGADVNVASRLDGVRPLHDAIERDHFGLVRLFLSWGADPTLSTYSGRTALKIASTKQMRDFLMAYFVDLNGAFHMDSETRWQLPLEIEDVTSSDYPYSDIYAGLPEDDRADQSSEIVFEMSDAIFIPCYYLTLEKGTRPSNYVILSDLLSKLDLSEEELVARHRSVVIAKRCLSELDGPDVYHLRRLYPPYSNLSLVLYDESVRTMMGIETFKFNRFDDGTSGRSGSGCGDSGVTTRPRGTAVVAAGLRREGRPKQVRSKVNGRKGPKSSVERGSPERKRLGKKARRVNAENRLPTADQHGDRPLANLGRPRFRLDGQSQRSKSRPAEMMMISLISGKTVVGPAVVSSVPGGYGLEPPMKSQPLSTPVFVLGPEINLPTAGQKEALICLLPDGRCESGDKALPHVSGLAGQQYVASPGFGEASPEDGCDLKITDVCSLSETAAKQVFGSDL